MTETIRLVLLLAGLVLIAGIYWWGRRGATQKDFSCQWDEVDDPDLAGLSFPPPVSDEEALRSILPTAMQPAQTPVDATAPRPCRETRSASQVTDSDEMLVVLTLLASQGEFKGPQLLDLFEQAGVYHGEMNIFHAPTDLERPQDDPLFSIANLLEPGVLEAAAMNDFSTPGLIMFMRLPGPTYGIEAYAHMLSVGRFLARGLDARLCDERHTPLNQATVSGTKERIQKCIGKRIVRSRDD